MHIVIEHDIMILICTKRSDGKLYILKLKLHINNLNALLKSQRYSYNIVVIQVDFNRETIS